MYDGVQGIFSERLKLLREQRRVTMVELAEAIGMSQAAISEWETGNKFPRSGALQQLATYFNVPMAYFFKEQAHSSGDLVKIRFYPLDPEKYLLNVLELKKSESVPSIFHELNEGVEIITLPASFLGEHADNDELMTFIIDQDSMDLILPDGSIIVTKEIGKDEANNGDIIICCYGNKLLIRRFNRNELEEVFIFSPESTNNSFYDIVVPFKSQKDIDIIAKVIWYGVLC